MPSVAIAAQLKVCWIPAPGPEPSRPESQHAESQQAQQARSQQSQHTRSQHTGFQQAGRSILGPSRPSRPGPSTPSGSSPSGPGPSGPGPSRPCTCWGSPFPLANPAQRAKSQPNAVTHSVSAVWLSVPLFSTFTSKGSKKAANSSYSFVLLVVNANVCSPFAEFCPLLWEPAAMVEEDEVGDQDCWSEAKDEV